MAVLAVAADTILVVTAVETAETIVIAITAAAAAGSVIVIKPADESSASTAIAAAISSSTGAISAVKGVCPAVFAYVAALPIVWVLSVRRVAAAVVCGIIVIWREAAAVGDVVVSATSL